MTPGQQATKNILSDVETLDRQQGTALRIAHDGEGNVQKAARGLSEKRSPLVFDKLRADCNGVGPGEALDIARSTAESAL